MTANDHGARDHALFGGSSASIYANCSGSIFLTKDLPPQEPTPDMLKGTRQHEVGEFYLKGFLQHQLEGSDPLEYVSKLQPTEEELSLAELYKEAVWNRLLKGSVTGKAYGLEDRFVIDEHLQMFGFVDFWAVYIDDRAKRVGVVCDYKNGFYKVPATKNPQLAFYCAAMLAEIRRGGKDLDYMIGSIVQPNTTSSDIYDEHKFSVKEIETWTKKFYKAAEQVLVKKKPVFKAGSWCKFCRAGGKATSVVCPTYAKSVSAKSSLALVDPEIVVLPPIDVLPDEVLSRIILNEDSILEFVKAVKAVGIERAKVGNPIPGTKAIQTQGNRKWLDDEEAVAEVLADYGVDPWAKKLKGLTEVERELAKNLSKQEAKEVVSSCCDRRQPTISLVSEADPRPSILSAKEHLLNDPINIE